jgi:hypothetical protein
MEWVNPSLLLVARSSRIVDISQRIRLVELAEQREGTVPLLPYAATPDTEVGQPESTPIGTLNDLLLDIGFVGEPIQCADKHICDELAQKFDFKGRQGWDKANKWVPRSPDVLLADDF